jgi:glycosyltransferase A (GT-A) superfamily protein (DUF2064 family)
VAAPATPRAVLLMARAPRPGTVRRALEPLLGPARCAALQSLLIRRAAAWAADVAPGAVHVGYEPADAGDELRTLLGHGVTLFPQNGAGISGRLVQAGARLFAGGHGPVLIIWPDLPRWSPELARAALGDLTAGCAVALGPEFDGGFYMLGLARPVGALFTMPEQAWRSPDAITEAITAAQRAGLEVGLLRAERGLRRPEDVRAALADPLTDPEIRAILS